MEKIKIKLEKSLIASLPKQRANARALGLRKIGDVTIQNNDDSVRGKIKVISHLISVEILEV